MSRPAGETKKISSTGDSSKTRPSKDGSSEDSSAEDAKSYPTKNTKDQLLKYPVDKIEIPKRAAIESNGQQSSPKNPIKDNLANRKDSRATPIWEEQEADLGPKGLIGEEWHEYDKSNGAAPDDDIDVWSYPAGFDKKRPDWWFGF